MRLYSLLIHLIETRLTLLLSVADFTFTSVTIASVTVFDMLGFLEQEIGTAINLGYFTFAFATISDRFGFLEQECSIAFFKTE